MINSSKDGPVQAVNIMTQRFRKNNIKITKLTLALSECCMKNCDKTFPHALTSLYLNEIISIASGKVGPDNAKDAIRFFEELYHDFHHVNPHIVETRKTLISKGVISEVNLSSTNE